MFTKYSELSHRRKIADVHNKKTGLFAKEFREKYGRDPSETECLHEIDRLQKLVDSKKSIR